MNQVLRMICICILLIINSISGWAQDCSTESSFKNLNFECLSSHSKKIEAQKKSYEIYAQKLKALKEKKGVDGALVRQKEFFYKLIANLSTKDEAKKQLNQTFFFQTAQGVYGKFIIRSADVGLSECSIYIDSTLYTSKGARELSQNLVIRNSANSWDKDTLSFVSSSTEDFVLMREHGRCALKSVDGVAFKFGETNEVEEITGNPILLYASYFLLGLAVFLVAQSVFKDEDRFKAESRLDDAEDENKQNQPNDFVLKLSQPFFKRYFSPVVKGMKYKKKLKEKYRRKLASSGMNLFLTPEDFFAFKLFLIIGFPILYLFGGKFLELEVELSYIPFLVVAGFFYPDLWIKEKIQKRKDEIMVNMPFVVDMLALSVEAGLDIVGAIGRVIEKAPKSALTDEFEIFLREIKVGATRAEAFRALSWRIDQLTMSSFCATIIAADSLGGGNLAPILKVLSAEIRQKRSSEIEKKGAQATTKMLFPMMAFILPAVILVIAAPFVIGFIEGQ